MNNSFLFYIFFIKGGIIEILDELGIDINNLDPEDLDLLIELIKKILNSGLGLSSITFWFLFLSLLYIIAYGLTSDRKTIELDLVAIRIKIGNFYYRGIVDLNDPRGLRLKTLYAWNENVRGLYVFCPELAFPRIYCVYSTTPLSGTVDIRLITTWTYDNDLQDYHISTDFHSPNRILWWALDYYYNLIITTGYGEYHRHICPNSFNVLNIQVFGLKDIFLADNRPTLPA